MQKQGCVCTCTHPWGAAGSHTTTQRDQLRRRLKSGALARNLPWLYCLHVEGGGLMRPLWSQVFVQLFRWLRTRRSVSELACCCGCRTSDPSVVEVQLRRLSCEGHLQVDTVSHDIRLDPRAAGRWFTASCFENQYARWTDARLPSVCLVPHGWAPPAAPVNTA